jgi:hypothetical protein
LLQDGSTPLHTAANMGHTGIVEALLKAGAVVDHQDHVRTSAAAPDVSTALDGCHHAGELACVMLRVVGHGGCRRGEPRCTVRRRAVI